MLDDIPYEDIMEGLLWLLREGKAKAVLRGGETRYIAAEYLRPEDTDITEEEIKILSAEVEPA